MSARGGGVNGGNGVGSGNGAKRRNALALNGANGVKKKVCVFARTHTHCTGGYCKWHI
jgi:hypothetical protein